LSLPTESGDVVREMSFTSETLRCAQDDKFFEREIGGENLRDGLGNWRLTGKKRLGRLGEEKAKL
jgi:hypothetical protein